MTTPNIRTGIGFDSHILNCPGARPLAWSWAAWRCPMTGAWWVTATATCWSKRHHGRPAGRSPTWDDDKGQHFPSSDEQYRDISSLLLLGQVAEQVAAGGWRIANVDATMLAQRPRLGCLLFRK